MLSDTVFRCVGWIACEFLLGPLQMRTSPVQKKTGHNSSPLRNDINIFDLVDETSCVPAVPTPLQLPS